MDTKDIEARLKPVKHVKNIFILLFSAIFVALVGVVAMAYWWGPSGDYQIKNILLAPKTLHIMNFEAEDPTNGQQARFAFDHLEFYESPAQKRGIQIPIERYEPFYQTVSNKNSISKENLDLLFSNDQFSRLVVYVKNPNRDNYNNIFQEIHFSTVDPSYMRVEIHEDGADRQWAYFHIKNIGEKAKKDFLKL